MSRLRQRALIPIFLPTLKSRINKIYEFDLLKMTIISIYLPIFDCILIL